MSDLAKAFRQYASDGKKRLKALPYADESEPGGDAVEMLATAFASHSPIDVLRWEGGLSDPYFRVLALDFLAQRTQLNSEVTIWDGRELSEPTLIAGDLRVTGNLENASNLVVLGNLEVAGAYLACAGGYPCCSVAGSMTVNNFYANEAETICLGTLTAKSALVVVYNHTVTITRELVAKLVLASDAHITGKISSPSHHQDPGYEIYKDIFGLEFDEDDDDFEPGEYVYEGVIAHMLDAGT